MSSSLDPNHKGRVSLIPIVSEEVGEVAKMASVIWPAAYESILQSEQIDYMLGRMYGREQLHNDFVKGVRMWWICLDGERVGFLAVGPIDVRGECPLHKFYLLPPVQGKGCGSQAFARLVEILSDEGTRRIELRVNRHNGAAIGFYRKNGFSIHGENCRDIGDGFFMDDFLMGRDLPS